MFMKFSSSSSAMYYLISTDNVDTAGKTSKVLVVSDVKGLSTLSAADYLSNHCGYTIYFKGK